MIAYDRSAFSNDILLSLYQKLLKPRLVEEKMLILLRQNKLTKWFSGIGQEAIAVGVTAALHEDEYIFPLHRNLGVFTTRNVPLQKLFAQWQGKKSGYTKGRDRSFHFGSKEHHIVGMISHLGAMLPVADGVALAQKLEGKNKVCVAFIGDGGTSEGDFHEALNVAAVWKLPVIFLVENNGYSLSTPTSEQFAIKSFTEKAAGYGIESYKIDGNNVLEVYQTIKNVSDKIRFAPAPVLIEASTFRMRGHEEASPTKYVPEEMFEQWAKHDPVVNFETFLLDENLFFQSWLEFTQKTMREEIDLAWDNMEAEEEIESSVEQELADVYAPFEAEEHLSGGGKTNKRYIDAIKDAMDVALSYYPNLVLMGQDIAEYGGVFKATEGLSEKYGKERVRNTPLCESAILGASLGLAIEGYKSVVEMQFADFVSCGFNQIANNLAKSHYRWAQAADVVVRMPTGAGTGAGPFHSQSTEAWFAHIPGLKIVFPSNPVDAKGLMLAAIEDPNPVLFFEHKALYRSVSELVPDGFYTVPIGKAKVVNEGESLSLITYGACVHWATECVKANGLEDEVDIIDLRSLVPLDKETLLESIQKTGKVLLLTEDTATGSIMSDISAWIGETLFEHLDAPVVRLSSLDTPVPFAKDLEEMFLPKQEVLKKIQELLAY
jgi:2-oxoisovalerate dehydrogenase E1 component